MTGKDLGPPTGRWSRKAVGSIQLLSWWQTVRNPKGVLSIPQAVCKHVGARCRRHKTLVCRNVPQACLIDCYSPPYWFFFFALALVVPYHSWAQNHVGQYCNDIWYQARRTPLGPKLAHMAFRSEPLNFTAIPNVYKKFLSASVIDEEWPTEASGSRFVSARLSDCIFREHGHTSAMHLSNDIAVIMTEDIVGTATTIRVARMTTEWYTQPRNHIRFSTIELNSHFQNSSLLGLTLPLVLVFNYASDKLSLKLNTVNFWSYFWEVWTRWLITLASSSPPVSAVKVSEKDVCMASMGEMHDIHLRRVSIRWGADTPLVFNHKGYDVIHPIHIHINVKKPSGIKGYSTSIHSRVINLGIISNKRSRTPQTKNNHQVGNYCQKR